MIRVVWVLGLLIAATLPAMAQDTTGVVIVSVRDQSGQPVRDALVSIDTDSAAIALRGRTSAQGIIRFPAVRVGSHAIQVIRLGYAPTYSSFTADRVETRVTLELRAIAMPLDSIVVRAARTGLHGLVTTRGMELLPHAPRPVRGATVEILDQRFRARTDRDGRFSIGALGEGSYSVLVRSDGLVTRVVPIYVPPENGVDVTIVLDSMVADYQRRDDVLMREMSLRLREANNPSALVGEHELRAPPGTSLREALREAPSAISRGLILKDDVTCVYLNGEPRNRMTADDILAEDVRAVEVYGLDAKQGTMRPKGWRKQEFCGTGMNEGPLLKFTESYNIARVIVVWTKRRR